MPPTCCPRAPLPSSPPVGYPDHHAPPGTAPRSPTPTPSPRIPSAPTAPSPSSSVLPVPSHKTDGHADRRRHAPPSPGGCARIRLSEDVCDSHTPSQRQMQRCAKNVSPKVKGRGKNQGKKRLGKQKTKRLGPRLFEFVHQWQWLDPVLQCTRRETSQGQYECRIGCRRMLMAFECPEGLRRRRAALACHLTSTLVCWPLRRLGRVRNVHRRLGRVRNVHLSAPVALASGGRRGGGVA